MCFPSLEPQKSSWKCTMTIPYGMVTPDFSRVSIVGLKLHEPSFISRSTFCLSPNHPLKPMHLFTWSVPNHLDLWENLDYYFRTQLHGGSHPHSNAWHIYSTTFFVVCDNPSSLPSCLYIFLHIISCRKWLLARFWYGMVWNDVAAMYPSIA